MAVPVVKGLYFEGAQLKYDLVWDWERCWSPIREVLTLVAQSAFQNRLGSNRLADT
jgi:hypothetical protein